MATNGHISYVEYISELNLWKSEMFVLLLLETAPENINYRPCLSQTEPNRPFV